MDTRRSERGSALSGLLTAIAFIGLYLALQLWLLPAAGVST
jgi:hypothetical protein